MVYKNINTNNPTIPKFIYHKQKIWDKIVLDKRYKKDNILLLRNNVMIRELVVELDSYLEKHPRFKSRSALIKFILNNWLCEQQGMQSKYNDLKKLIRNELKNLKKK